MPTSVPPSDDTPRPRLWGDTHCQGDRRHLAEVAAARLLETTMPVTSTLSGTRSEPPVATTESRVAHAYTPEPGDAPASRPLFIPEPARESPIIDITARQFNPLATFRSELAVRPHLASPPATQRLRPVRSLSRDWRALVPARARTGVAGTVVIAALGAIAIMFWPGTSTDAPAVTRSEVAIANADRSGSGTAALAPSSVTASSTVPSAVVATGGPAASDTIGRTKTPAARRTTRKAPSVAQAANQSATPVTPVSRPSVAQLRVTSTPPGARVTINGIGWGQTPVTVSNLPLGAKTVRVTIEGYRSQQRTVDLRSAGASAAVHLALKADAGMVNR